MKMPIMRKQFFSYEEKKKPTKAFQVSLFESRKILIVLRRRNQYVVRTR